MRTLESILTRRPKAPMLAAGVAALVGGLTGCEQAAPKCTIAHGDFAATYELVDGDDGPCSELVVGVLNVSGYPTQTAEDDKVPNYDDTNIAIQTQETTDILWSGRATNPDDTNYAFGGFESSEPDGDDFCVVPELDEARIRAPEDMDMGLPAVDMAYKWTNVRVVTNANTFGTLLEADLEYTVDGCTANYTVKGVFPAVFCGSPDPDFTPPDDDPEAEAPLVPDIGLCNPEPTPENYGYGSGLNPDLDIECHPEGLLCVLAE